MGLLGSLFKRRKKKKTSLSPPPHPSKADLRLVFSKFDANGDGKISVSELGSILSSLSLSATSSNDVEAMMREADADGDGFIDMEEFIALNTNNNYDPEEVLKDAFGMFDMDKNGAISADELFRVLKNLGEDCSLSECKKMIDGVDRDGDGSIDFDEFKAMMTKGLSLD